MSFVAIGRFLLPGTATEDDMLETDAWDPGPMLQVAKDNPAVWGRAPAPSGTDWVTLVNNAWHREQALFRLRRANRFRIHRWTPGHLRPGVVRNRLRGFVRGGALVELNCDTRRVLDEVADAAGLLEPITRFTVGSGGVLHSRVDTAAGGAGALLKVAPSGDPADPAYESLGLDLLSKARITAAPQLLGAGRIAGTSWSLQSILPGNRPGRISDELAIEVGRFCKQLPRSTGGWTSLETDAATVAEALPSLAEAIGAAARRAAEGLEGTPTVLRHGDLWSANLLVRRGKLTGVVDWDAWDQSGVPGADLLQLVVRERARKRNRPLGALWADQPWLSEQYRHVTEDYWDSLGVQPTTAMLDAVGWAWWVNQVAASMSRLPRLASDKTWLEANVLPVTRPGDV